MLSNSGFATANGIVGPNGYRNSYGYSLGPDITFQLGNFAVSDTTATYGAAYFTDPSGFSNILIPGIAGPENITSRNVTEILKSGDRFQPAETGPLSASSAKPTATRACFPKRPLLSLSLCSLNPEIALLATGGYDAIHNSLGLSKDLSGPVGHGRRRADLRSGFRSAWSRRAKSTTA